MGHGLSDARGGCVLVITMGDEAFALLFPPCPLPSSRRTGSGAQRGRSNVSSCWLCSYKKFQDVCAGTALTRCDFSGLSKYGNHTLRVRAEQADQHSPWVTLIFCPVDDSESPRCPSPVVSSWCLGVPLGLARRREVAECPPRESASEGVWPSRSSWGDRTGWSVSKGVKCKCNNCSAEG